MQCHLMPCHCCISFRFQFHVSPYSAVVLTNGSNGCGVSSLANSCYGYVLLYAMCCMSYAWLCGIWGYDVGCE